MRALAAQAERSGLKIAIYPHIGDWTERFEDAFRVARLVDRKNFGVTFNLCHTLAAGDEERIPALLEAGRHLLLAVTINGADANVKGPRRSIRDPSAPGTALTSSFALAVAHSPVQHLAPAFVRKAHHHQHRLADHPPLHAHLLIPRIHLQIRILVTSSRRGRKATNFSSSSPATRLTVIR